MVMRAPQMAHRIRPESRWGEYTSGAWPRGRFCWVVAPYASRTAWSRAWTRAQSSPSMMARSGRSSTSQSSFGRATGARLPVSGSFTNIVLFQTQRPSYFAFARMVWMVENGPAEPLGPPARRLGGEGQSLSVQLHGDGLQAQTVGVHVEDSSDDRRLGLEDDPFGALGPGPRPVTKQMAAGSSSHDEGVPPPEPAAPPAGVLDLEQFAPGSAAA